jgi:hypothetical protein
MPRRRKRSPRKKRVFVFFSFLVLPFPFLFDFLVGARKNGDLVLFFYGILDNNSD